MIIIGLGTGRCGTLSLSNLLSMQGCVVTHEETPLPHWDLSNKSDIINRVESYKSNNSNYCGDVCSAYLEYVYIIQDILKDKVRFLCLERSKEDNIKSWMIKTKKNLWSSHENPDYWSCMFPKYDNTSKIECLSMYWEYYRTKSDLLSRKMTNFKKINTEELNNDQSVKDILEFCDINPINIKKVHSNATKP